VVRCGVAVLHATARAVSLPYALWRICRLPRCSVHLHAVSGTVPLLYLHGWTVRTPAAVLRRALRSSCLSFLLLHPALDNASPVTRDVLTLCRNRRRGVPLVLPPVPPTRHWRSILLSLARVWMRLVLERRSTRLGRVWSHGALLRVCMQWWTLLLQAGVGMDGLLVVWVRLPLFCLPTACPSPPPSDDAIPCYLTCHHLLPPPSVLRPFLLPALVLRTVAGFNGAPPRGMTLLLPASALHLPSTGIRCSVAIAAVFYLSGRWRAVLPRGTLGRMALLGIGYRLTDYILYAGRDCAARTGLFGTTFLLRHHRVACRTACRAACCCLTCLPPAHPACAPHATLRRDAARHPTPTRCRLPTTGCPPPRRRRRCWFPAERAAAEKDLRLRAAGDGNIAALPHFLRRQNNGGRNALRPHYSAASVSRCHRHLFFSLINGRFSIPSDM